MGPGRGGLATAGRACRIHGVRTLCLTTIQTSERRGVATCGEAGASPLPPRGVSERSNTRVAGLRAAGGGREDLADRGEIVLGHADGLRARWRRELASLDALHEVARDERRHLVLDEVERRRDAAECLVLHRVETLLRVRTSARRVHLGVLSRLLEQLQ